MERIPRNWVLAGSIGLFVLNILLIGAFLAQLWSRMRSVETAQEQETRWIEVATAAMMTAAWQLTQDAIPGPSATITPRPIPSATLTPTYTSTATFTPTPSLTRTALVPNTPYSFVQVTVPTRAATMDVQATTRAKRRTQFPHSTNKATAVCNCDGATLTCGSFPHRSAAQACYNYCISRRWGDVFSLDRDGNGKACEDTTY